MVFCGIIGQKGRDEMSMLTKKALLKAFGTVLERKPFKKITVGDLTEECGISRMTFYYHFKDIYDMLKWALEHALRDSFPNASADFEGDWKRGFYKVFDFAMQHKYYALKILPEMGQSDMIRYLHDVVYRFAYNAILLYAGNRRIADGDLVFLAENCTYCVTGSLLKWAQTGMNETPDDMIRRFAVLFEAMVRGALERFDQEAASV